MWNFPKQGSNLCPLHWQADSYHWTAREVPVGNFGRNLFSLVSLAPVCGLWLRNCLMLLSLTLS